jgi:methionine--tRNA ligase beta chain
MITFEDFKKVDIVVGQILSAEKIPETDKLLKLSVDFAEEKPRTIVSGISLYFPDCSVLVGKKCMFVANLEPRVIRGIESEGMILAVSTDPRSAEGSDEARDGFFSLLEPSNDIPAGARAK